MMKRIAEQSPRFKARIAGALFLLGSLSAVFGESSNAVARHDGRKRTTMEGAGQPSGRVTNHSK
jgi:hypothetical protein